MSLPTEDSSQVCLKGAHAVRHRPERFASCREAPAHEETKASTLQRDDRLARVCETGDIHCELGTSKVPAKQRLKVDETRRQRVESFDTTVHFFPGERSARSSLQRGDGDASVLYGNATLSNSGGHTGFFLASLSQARLFDLKLAFGF